MLSRYSYFRHNGICFVSSAAFAACQHTCPEFGSGNQHEVDNTSVGFHEWQKQLYRALKFPLDPWLCS